MSKRGPSRSIELTTPSGSERIEFSAVISIKKWFTDISTVKEMFQVTTESGIIQNEEQIISGTRENYLNHKNIVVDSERVKKEVRVLPPEVITFTGSEWVNLGNNDIIKGTVKVYDLEEEIEMVEGKDYEMDYPSGKIKRLVYSGEPGTAAGASTGEGSSLCEFSAKITVENKVKVFYSYYKIFLKDIDYSINYERGSIARLESGNIESGSKVYIDYKKEESIRDSFISLMIDSAHTYIVSLIPESLLESLDSTQELELKYGESFYTLYLMNKFYAQKLIIDAKNDDVDLASKQLLEVAEKHRITAVQYLRKYVKFPGYRRKGLKVQKNISWDL
ncbi:hypothetical protein DRQ09_02445 [candidate division KSB1 bacterium]|nr:MAG: hypothetical protein DRQ09_02445 [candidate division KSB1 bacterium]